MASSICGMASFGFPVYANVAPREWWASAYSKHNDADHGALFCTFNTGGDPRMAECQFRDIQGRIADTFKILNSIGKDQLLGSAEEN